MDTSYSATSAAQVQAELPASLAGRPAGGRDILAFLRRSLFSIVGFAALFAAAGVVYVVTTPPTFVAAAQLLMDVGRLQAAWPDARQSELAPEQAYIESQIEIVKSDAVIGKVITELDLVNDPEFTEQSPTILQMARSWLTSSAGDLRVFLSSWNLDGNGEAIDKQRYVAAVVRSHVWVRRIGQSSVIEIAFSTGDAEKSALIANAIGRAYIQQDIDGKSKAAERGGNWLAGRLADLGGETNRALQAVERFKLTGSEAGAADARGKLAELQSVADTYQRVYEVFLQRYAETVQKISFPEADARFISEAAAPLSKSHPKGSLVVLFAALVGAAVGTGIASVRHVSDRRILSAAQIRRDVGIDCIGDVAEVTGRRATARLKMNTLPVPGSVSTQANESTPGRGRESEILRIVANAPKPFLRDIRHLNASIHAATIGRSSRSIGVVGSVSGEGTTTIALNLALLNAASGLRTLIVDTCADHPTISRILATPHTPGLMDALADQGIYAELCRAMEGNRFAVMPVGATSEAVTPGDCINSERAAFEIEDLKKAFDLVIFDLPALAKSPDARAIAPCLDGVVLVARHARTSLDTLSGSIASLTAVRANILGVILNRTPRRRGGSA